MLYSKSLINFSVIVNVIDRLLPLKNGVSYAITKLLIIISLYTL